MNPDSEGRVIQVPTFDTNYAKHLVGRASPRADACAPPPFTGKTPAISAPNDELLKAIELALADNWDAAHQIVQQYEEGTAAWIHAVLHKMEGDPGNARYWYRRADRMEHVEDEPRAELAAIQAELTTARRDEIK